MNFKLIIQGFGDETVLRIAGFDSIENYDIISKSNYLPLFLGYSDNDHSNRRKNKNNCRG